MNVLGHNQRVQGFLSVIKNSYPNIHYTNIVENYDDDSKSYEIVKK